jgi:hypothetical protein
MKNSLINSSKYGTLRIGIPAIYGDELQGHGATGQNVNRKGEIMKQTVFSLMKTGSRPI